MGRFVKQVASLSDLRKFASGRPNKFPVFYHRFRRAVFMARGSRAVVVRASRALLAWLWMVVAGRESNAIVLASVGSGAHSARVIPLTA